MPRTLIAIPTYNNAGTLGQVLDRTATLELPVLVVNDGATDDTPAILAQRPWVLVVAYPQNRGKAYAIGRALAYAAQQGYDQLVTLDSDGQHYPEDIPLLLDAAQQHPGALLVGARDLRADNMPGQNSFANRFSNFWYRLETGIELQDTQSGFRLYPVAPLRGIRTLWNRYEGELELLIRAAWSGVPVRNVPVRVYYPPREERVSHFRPFKDFFRISVLNSFAVLVSMLVYWPWRCLQFFAAGDLKSFVRTKVFPADESVGRIAGSVALGAFMGIFPVWGYQMLLATLLAHLLRLNKAIAIIASNISFPPMIPLILWGSCATGAWILNKPLGQGLGTITLESVWQILELYLLGSVVLACIAGVSLGGCTYLILRLVRRKGVGSHDC